MKIAYFLAILALSLSGGKIQAQQSVVIEVLTALGGKMNLHFPIADSLHPFAVKEIADLQKKFGLSSREVAEIRQASNMDRGIRLNTIFLPGGRLISSKTLYEAYQTGDSSSLTFIENNKPFYTLSIPLFFDGGQKAIIDIDLIGGGGYTYLLVKQQGGWAIEKEIVRWIV